MRKSDGSRHLACERFCADSAAAWRVVEELARGADDSARRLGEQSEGGICVKNNRDEVVILVGMASARVLTGQNSPPPAPLPARKSA
jgi:hypothetical protein